jgi:N-methylhydantoinase A
VTDANLVLGYLDPESFCGGRLHLRRDGVEEAILRVVGRPLGLPLDEAAHGIFRVVNASMANAIRRVLAKRRADPRELVLVAYGGNGGIHAPMQAEDLGIRRILVPRTAPAFSALGGLLTDPAVDELRSYIVPAQRIALDRLNALLADMEKKAIEALASNGATRVEIRRFAQLCCPAQTFDIAVPLASPTGSVTVKEIAAMIERFHRRYEELRTDASRDEQPILRGLRIRAVSVSRKPVLARSPRARGPVSDARKATRRAYFEGRYATAPVYDGAALRAGHEIKGPAIVEETFTTMVVYPRQRAAVDDYGNYWITC